MTKPGHTLLGSHRLFCLSWEGEGGASWPPLAVRVGLWAAAGRRVRAPCSSCRSLLVAAGGRGRRPEGGRPGSFIR